MSAICVQCLLMPLELHVEPVQARAEESKGLWSCAISGEYSLSIDDYMMQDVEAESKLHVAGAWLFPSAASTWQTDDCTTTIKCSCLPARKLFKWQQMATD